MKQAATQELYSYWDRLRGERLSPERGEIDPAAIRGILADTFILEVDQARRYPFRLAGTRLNALFMAELKGRSFQSLWAQPDSAHIADVLACVCDDAAAIVAGVTAAPQHRPAIELELLLLPVRHLGKTHSRILGCLAPARHTTWIGLLPVEFLELQALRILPHTGPDESRPSIGPATAVGGQVVQLSQRRKTARRGHLFVHQGGR